MSLLRKLGIRNSVVMNARDQLIEVMKEKEDTQELSGIIKGRDY